METDMKPNFTPITVQEMYAEEKPSDFVSWNICHYINRLTGRKNTCDCCPSSHKDPDYDEVIDGCRLTGDELGRIIIAALKKEGWTPPKKPLTPPSESNT